MNNQLLNPYKIGELVQKNYIIGGVLHRFGIKFYENTHISLAEVCENYGVSMPLLVKTLENYPTQLSAPLPHYSVRLIIEYLKESHRYFIYQKLPYLCDLIENFADKNPIYLPLAKDLQLLFPLFVEDIAQHIQAEETALFRYLLLLCEAKEHPKNTNWTKLYAEMQKNSVQYFALEHHTHTDEMQGIREITKNYHIDIDTPLHLKVLYQELQCLEKDMQLHAQIEDEILFVKALPLEHQIRGILAKKFQEN